MMSLTSVTMKIMIFDLYKMISGIDQLRTRGGEGGQIHHLFNAKIQSNIFLDSNILSLCIWILIVYLYLYFISNYICCCTYNCICNLIKTIILNPQVDREHTGSTLKCTAHNGAETVEQLERARARVTLDVRFDGDD